MRLICIFAGIVIFSTVACGTQDSLNSGGDADTSRVLATVGEVEITENIINEELNMIPPYQRSSFETPEGKRLLLNHIIERELLLLEAQNLGLEEDSFVVAQVELAMQQVGEARDRALLQTYYQQEVVDAVVIPEEDILAYYNDHIDDIYYQESQVKISHVIVSSAEEAANVAAALEAGDAFESVVDVFSEHEPTRASGGDMGWVTINSPMPYLGEQAEISQALFNADIDDIVGPFETAMGHHYFTITDKMDEGARPFEEVRESIENTLKPTIVNSYFQDTIIPDLTESYGVVINEDAFLPDESVSPDSLFQSAQNLMESNPETAVEYYKLFIHRFPDHENAHQAQFLMGFTLSEYVGNYETAAEAFQQLIDNYPESDFVDDAEWMIENMGTPPESLFIETLPEIEEISTETSGE
ncbi:MAG: peptidyl-prolyl cis-trans isomerase [Candidatus Aegiribacteria sp.]|nr:peptidyl-prolyl cis-trans isomerase [Candidatus Aegiribacteria sp.]